ncbi:MAG: 50S ribosomal protein L10 [Acidiferrobacter thiooxydans]
MSLNLEQKKAVVAEVSAAIAGADAAVVAEYRGLTVAQMTSLRAEARKAGVYVKVVKNTLVRRVVANTSFACLDGHLKGPLAFAASSDPVAVAKVLSEFARANDKLVIKVGAMGGALMTGEQLQALALLPSREVLLATLMRTMQAPIAQFVRTLNEVPARFVRTLAAIRDKAQ